MNHKKYKKEILSVYKDDVCIGFMARRGVGYGCCQDINNGWMITRRIVNPEWEGSFPTRKEARSKLVMYWREINE